MNAHPASLDSLGLERVHYFPRQLITAADMTVEQEYFRQKLRRHNRFMHGWGVVCGLEVTTVATKEHPRQVMISPGYALSPYGDEIYLSEPACYDLLKCGPRDTPNPCEPGGPPIPLPDRPKNLWVAIRYAQCQTRPVRVHPAGCGCDEMTCEFSRFRDDFEIGCLTKQPSRSAEELLCDQRNRRELPDCPPCPEEDWVVLAVVKLPRNTGQELVSGDINNFVRRQLYSTAMLQAQLIACCCEPPPPPPPPPPQPARVTKVEPAHEAVFNLQYDQVPQISVTFSKAIDSDTVNASTFRVIRENPQKVLSGTITWTGSKMTYFFQPKGGWLPGPEEVFDYAIRLIGTGAEPIKDMDDGLALDGEFKGKLPSGDGQPGGSFASTFRITGSDVPK